MKMTKIVNSDKDTDVFYIKLEDGTIVSVGDINIDEESTDESGNVPMNFEMDLIENPNNVTIDDVSDEVSQYLINVLETALKEFNDT